VAAEGIFNRDAAEVVDVIFSTLPLYDDRQSQAAVVKLITRGLKESAFVKVFAGTLVQIIEKSHRNSSDAVRLKLLRWSCLLFAQVPTLLSAKAAFCRLAAAQGFLLASLYQGPVRLRRATRHIFTRYLSNVRIPSSRCDHLLMRLFFGTKLCLSSVVSTAVSTALRMQMYLFTQVKGALECYVAEVESFPLESNCGIMKSLLDFCIQNQSLLDVHKVIFFLINCYKLESCFCVPLN